MARKLSNFGGKRATPFKKTAGPTRTKAGRTAGGKFVKGHANTKAMARKGGRAKKG